MPGASVLLPAETESRFPLRIPIRWRWTMLVGSAVAIAVVVLFFIILDIEREAWLQSQAKQAVLQVDRLADELKLPLLSGSSAETDLVVQTFLDKVPAVLGVLIRHADGRVRTFAETGSIAMLTGSGQGSAQVQRIPGKQLWYTRSVLYAETPLALLAVRFSEQEWDHIAGRLVQKISLAAVLVVVFSAIIVLWISGRMSRPIEMLADAAARVADGDYKITLPVHGNDEISDAAAQFNVMTRELAHKEELRGVFSRYLNPKLIADVFDGGDTVVESSRQEVSVLFADMVGFTSFSESSDTGEVVQVLNRYFELFHRVISYYGGHVDKYIGDAVMAVFNHPIHDQAHVRSACMAALAMNLACHELGIWRADGEVIRFRIGLNCGQAIIGNIGAARRLEYTVIGDVVNVASRLGEMGRGGEVVMSREMFSLLDDGFAFESIGSREIKGVSRKIEVGIVKTVNESLRRDIAYAAGLAFQRELSEDGPELPDDARA
ncbi:MAG: adenylate/guanylate cyclase domain-containing protein [Mariprofundus sp.]